MIHHTARSEGGGVDGEALGKKHTLVSVGTIIKGQVTAAACCQFVVAPKRG